MKGIDRNKTWKFMLIIAVIGMLLIPVDLAVSSLGAKGAIISEHGKLYMIRPGPKEAAQHFEMRAEIDDGSENFEKKINISLAPYSEVAEEEEEEQEAVMSVRDRTEYELRSAVGDLNGDLSRRKVMLPTELASGAKVKWSRQSSSNTVLITLLTMLLMIAVYRKSYGDLRKEAERRGASVMHQLPEFVNRLVLLLDAGLVLNTALEKAVEQSIRDEVNEKDYFYSRMRDIYDTVHNTNGSMSTEFKNFAKESGIRELLRLSNIIEDNIHKGAALSEKLEAESENLWISRKKACEEKGRLSETKMTVPLMMFLMVLIVITVAPAMIEL